MPHPPHINPVGDIIGAIGGIGLGYFGAQAQQKQQQENQTADMLAQAALKDPSILKDPEVQKLLTKRRGKDYVGFLTKIGQANQAAMASFPGGGGGAPQGAPGQGGTPGAAPPGGGAAPAMIGAAGGTPAPGGPAGAPPAGGAAPTAPGAAAPVDPVQKLMDENNALMKWGVDHPDHEDLVNQHIKQNNFTIEQLNKSKATEGNLAERKSRDDATDAFRSATLSMKASEESFNNWYKTQTLKDKGEAKTEADRAKLETGFNNHASMLMNHSVSLKNALQAKLASGGYTDKTAKPVVDAFNKQVEQMAKKAKDLGVDFDPDDYKIAIEPGKPGYFGTSVGSTPASVSSPASDDPTGLIGKY